MRKLFTLLIALFLWAGSSWAQVSTYTFAGSSGTFTPITLATGGTLVAAATSSTVILDDNNYSAQAIPFSFKYNGVNYTTYNINTNASITFGATLPSTSLYSPISVTELYDGAIAAIAADLDGRFTTTATRTLSSPILTAVGSFNGVVVGEEVSGTGIPAGTTIVSFDAGAGTITLSANATAAGTAVTTVIYSGQIMTQTDGVTPNRVVTIQWRNFKRYGSGSTTYNGETYTFQVKLHETTNVIDIVYGPVYSSTTSASRQVGLRGLTNADFNNRTTTTNWAGTTAGASNAATCSISSTVLPASGQTFTFNPPVTGTPDPPTTPSPANAATGVAVNGSLTWTFGANTVTYDLMFGPTGSMTQVVTGAAAGATGSYAYSGLANSSFYQWQVIEHNGALTTNGPVWSFFTVCGVYAVPFTENFDSYTVPAFGCGTVIDVNADVIKWATTTGTTYNGANKLSIGYSAVGVTMNDWYIAPGVALTGGVSYDVKFYYRVALTAYPERMEVKWGDAPTVAGMTSTAIFTQTDFSNSTYVLGSGSFTPATTGTYYVGWHCFSQPDEDGIYLDQIVIEATPACPAPLAATVAAITNNSANIGWTGGAANVNIKYGAVGFDPNTAGTLVATSTNPQPIGPLTAATAYDAYVQQDCGGGTLSPWTAPVTFTTACDPVTSLSEHFDAVTAPALPTCWGKYTAPLFSFQTVLTYATLPNTAPNCVQLYSSGALAAADAPMLITPALSNMSAATNQLRFFAKGASTNLSVVVGTMSDPTNSATFVPIQTFTGLSTSTWTECIVSFAAYAGTDTYIAFRHPLTTTYSYVYIDDVFWEPLGPRGTVEGYVREGPLCTAGIKQAIVSNGTYSDEADGDGFYRILNVPVGTYSFTASLAGFTSQTVTGISVANGATTTQDFCLPLYGDPPTNLTATVTGLDLRDVHVAWQAPGSLPPDQYIKWDDGVQYSAIGITGGGTFSVASRWPVADIAPFGGMFLKKIKFYVGDAAASFTLKVWKGTNAAILLHSQAVTVVAGYNEITLTTGIPVDGTQEFWFGYETTHGAGTFPAGVDNGPNIEGKGNMITNAGAWTTLYTLSTTLPYNWILNGYLTQTAKSAEGLTPMVQSQQPVQVASIGSGMVTKKGSSQNGTFAAMPQTGLAPVQVVSSEQSTITPMAPSVAPTGYNVYRNTVKVANNIPGLVYDDTALPKGGYDYQVSAVYATGAESAKIGPVHVNIYTCNVPTAVDVPVGTITTNSAIANWTPSTLSTNPEWIVEYGLAGFAHGAGLGIHHVSSPTYTMNSLLPATAYSFYVRTYCAVGDSSLWVGPYTFTTACPAAITTYPYHQNFDATTIPAIPVCWSQYSSAALRPWVTNASTTIGNVSPPNFVGVFYSATAAKDEWLISPPMQFTPGTPFQVKFWVDAPGYLGVPEKLKLVMSTDPSLAGMAAGTVLWDGNNLLTTAYTEFIVPFTPATAGPYYFGWYAYSVMDVDYIAMDNITFEAATPLSITGATVTDVTGCNGNANGSIVPTVVGGTTPYTYMWNTGAATASLTGLVAGVYSLTVTDAALATDAKTWTVLGPSAISVGGSPTNASCPTSADGAITLNVSGGTPAYAFAWSNGATTQNLSGLNPGTYSVTVTDANGCTALSMVGVGQASSVCNNITVTGFDAGANCYNAVNTITVAGVANYVVQAPNGDVTFIAGHNILFEPGTKVEPGAKMVGKISMTFCPAPTAPMTAAVTTGSEESPMNLSNTWFTLYPNPTNGNFTLVQKGEAIYGTVKVDVYSMSGEKVMTEQMIGEKKHEFRFSDIPVGLYFVRVVADNYVETIKLIKTR
ncbi:MAG: choice-of-anchor J domain-containing protein [Bacteroidetes bacterium]|nr:choice-of-anchor J domain-containing protein [Bacteroidota bacterium]